MNLTLTSTTAKTFETASNSQLYPPEDFEKLFAIEDAFFWFKARNRVIHTILAPIITQRAAKVIEIGCGTGYVLRMLSEQFQDAVIVGADLFFSGLKFAQRRVPKGLVQCDMRTAPFAKGQFDVVCMCDVLEHIPEHDAALQTAYDLLRPGGHLLVTVPARMSLWSYHDEHADHCRRYELGQLTAHLQKAQFQVDYITEFMSMLYPILWLGRRMQRKMARTTSQAEMAYQQTRIPRVINYALDAYLQLENAMIQRRKRLPIGTSLIALAKKD
ncbi:MAG: class I SAM-dependent methyltransferase [Anaerolineae bacterium]|nr:class I SAM-dependent methyltransferase [Anaerolineae bacterium]